MSPFQILSLVVQVAIEILKLYRQQAVAKGAKLTPADKAAINKAVVSAIKDKDTSGLEALIGCSGAAPAEPAEAPKP